MMRLDSVTLMWDGGLKKVIMESSRTDVVCVKVRTTLSSPGGKVDDASSPSATW